MAMICCNTPSVPVENMSSAEQQCVCLVCPVHVLLQVCAVCCAWGGTCSSTAEWECLWPSPSPFRPHKVDKPAVTLTCVWASVRMHVSHVTTAEAAAALSCFAGLKRAAAHWFPLLNAWRGWQRHSCSVVHIVPRVSHNNAGSGTAHRGTAQSCTFPQTHSKTALICLRKFDLCSICIKRAAI